MDEQLQYFIVKTPDNKMQFVINKMIITVDKFLHENNKHTIINARAATAHFAYEGLFYDLSNDQAFLTIEDWYLKELLPQLQLLSRYC